MTDVDDPDYSLRWTAVGELSARLAIYAVLADATPAALRRLLPGIDQAERLRRRADAGRFRDELLATWPFLRGLPRHRGFRRWVADLREERSSRRKSRGSAV